MHETLVGCRRIITTRPVRKVESIVCIIIKKPVNIQ